MNKAPQYTEARTIAFIVKKDGIECPFVRLQNSLPGIQDFISYAKMECDLMDAKESFLASLKSDSPTLSGALLNEAIIGYSRPFKPGNQRSVRKLNYLEIFKDVVSQQVHTQIQILRDKFYAHADENDYEDIFVCVALNPNHNEKNILDIYRSMPRSCDFDEATINNFVYVTNQALEWINDKLNLEREKIMSYLGRCDIDKIYRDSVDPGRYDKSVQKFYLEYPFNA